MVVGFAISFFLCNVSGELERVVHVLRYFSFCLPCASAPSMTVSEIFLLTTPSSLENSSVTSSSPSKVLSSSIEMLKHCCNDPSDQASKVTFVTLESKSAQMKATQYHYNAYGGLPLFGCHMYMTPEQRNLVSASVILCPLGII